MRVYSHLNDPHPGLTLAYDIINYDALYLRASEAQLVMWRVRGGTSDAVVLATLSNQPRKVFLTLGATVNAANAVTQVRLGDATFTVNYPLIGG